LKQKGLRNRYRKTQRNRLRHEGHREEKKSPSLSEAQSTDIESIAIKNKDGISRKGNSPLFFIAMLSISEFCVAKRAISLSP
jgi:hypothetical protein